MDKLPVVETFTSIQGEGVWAGTLMFFLRLAGCNVGEFPIESPAPLRVLREQYPQHSVCHTVDGQAFLCDTNYHVTRKMSVADVEKEFQESGCQHICVTGGEPMLHSEMLVRWLHPMYSLGKAHVHFETSGTLPIPSMLAMPYMRRWITCSPKQGFKKEHQALINEWKFVVGPNTDLTAFSELVAQTAGALSNVPIFIQPVNHVGEVDMEQLPRCLELLHQHPQWRLSVQLHKLLRVR